MLALPRSNFKRKCCRKSEHRIKYTNKQNDISLIRKVCIFPTTFPTYMNFSNTASDDKEWNASAAATPLAVLYYGPLTKCKQVRDTLQVDGTKNESQKR